MSGHHASDEYDFEPVPGLPEILPEDEHILWQGGPDWRSLARRAFHVNKVAVYFVILLLWRLASGSYDGQTFAALVVGSIPLVAMALLAVGLLLGLARLNSHMTLYTITNKRVVMRHGVALAMAINFPFRIVESAGLKSYSDGTGDIPLSVEGAGQFGYLILWPHARAWKFGDGVEPMMRSVAGAENVAAILADALAAATEGQSVRKWRVAEQDGGAARHEPLNGVATAS